MPDMRERGRISSRSVSSATRHSSKWRAQKFFGGGGGTGLFYKEKNCANFMTRFGKRNKRVQNFFIPYSR